MLNKTRNFPNISGWKHQSVLNVFSIVRHIGALPDGVRLALIIEGGALRGVISCGYAMALSELISDRCFSFVYGAPSGGLNGVYFSAQSLDLALKIYSENATDPQCTNIWKFPNVLNADWLVDTWMFGKRQFNVNILHSTTSEVRIVLTRLDDGRPFYFDARRAPLELLNKAMKATSYAPLLTEKCQIIDGVAYGDGAIGDTFPYRQAISDGATHIVCLTTRTENYRKRIGPVEKLLHRVRLLGHKKEYIKAYFNRPAKYNESLDLIYKGGIGTVPTLVLRPQNEGEIPRSVETNPKAVRRFGDNAVSLAREQLSSALAVS